MCFKNLNTFASVVIICISLFSCTTYKNIPYFKDVSDSANIYINTTEFSEPLVQYDDILSISINTLDGSSSTMLSMPSSSSASTGLISGLSNGANTVAVPYSASYRVDKTGNIDVPLIGKLNVLGKTTSQIKDAILAKTLEYFKTPTVDVRFSNFRITVLGEVTKPSAYTFSNEKVTIFDALGQAGDLSIFGKRDNVLLIRDSVGKKQMVRLNLNSKSLISSPYFYLRQNDVVYVEPTKDKIAALDAVQTKYISIASGVLSLLIIFATRKF